MEKNTVWAVVLSTLVLIVFMFIQMMFFSDVPLGNQLERETIENEQIVASSILSPTTELISESESQQETITENENLAEEQFVINTNKARITFSNRGGDIIGYELIEHRDGDTGVEMADNIWSENRAFSVAFGGTENEGTADEKLKVTVSPGLVENTNLVGFSHIEWALNKTPDAGDYSSTITVTISVDGAASAEQGA